jgi:hypothetical protein
MSALTYMLGRMTGGRWLGLPIVVLVGLFGGEAHADETRECAAAYEQAQRQQQKAELLSALDAAERCARPSCPALLRDECSHWVPAIRSKLPSLVVNVRASDGCTRSDSPVDPGGPSRKAAESGALLIDPGVHDIRVTDPVSSASKVQTINFAPGERRDIDVDFAPEGAVCTPASSSRKVAGFTIAKPTLIIGAAGGGLLLGGALLGLIGAIKRSDLDECKPNCPQERIDGVRPFFVAGDVMAGFGILALGAATVMFLTVDAKTPAASTPEPRARIVVGANGIGAVF